jgi:aarF domain-containing kinase
VTLEGIALRGNPSYSIVTEAYPFVARKLLREDRPEIQRALVDLLYGGGPTGAPLQLTRLAVVLNGAMGVVARGSGAFVDFDTLPDDSVGAKDVLKYLLSPGARSLRDLLRPEALTAADLLFRQLIRLSFRRLENALAPPAFLRFLPNPTEAPVPFLLPSLTGAPTPALLSPRAVVDAAAPALDRNEEVYALSLVDLAKSVLGADAAAVLTGEAWDQPQAVARLLLSLLATGRPVGTTDLQAAAATAAHAVGPAPGGDQPVLRELQDALRGLGTEEQEALRQMAVDLATQLWGRLVGRVSSLGQGPARRVDPVAV